MDRREALERIALFMGGAVSAPTLAGVLSGCTAGSENDSFEARTLSDSELEMVATIAEHILPKTDTPGAREAGVHEFVENMLTSYYEAEDVQEFMEGLGRCDDRADEMAGSSFLALNDEEQIQLLQTLEAAEDSFFDRIKELTLAGYYTSEIGATIELHMHPYGAYYPDIPLSEVGRAWA